MSDLDMSRPGSELFPESKSQQYNSYQDVMVGQVVDDPLNMGVKQSLGDAGQGQLSDKEMNFRALSDVAAKLKEEREYWKGQAEAYSKQAQPVRSEPQREEPMKGWDESDWSDGKNVKSAFETLRNENQSLREEIKDHLSALQIKTQHSNWDNMVKQHVPELTSKNPIFAEMIQNTSNPYEAAYLLAELNSRAGQQQAPAQGQPPVNDNAQRAMANSLKPASIATVGGHGKLSDSDYYASMSDEDFMKVAARNMASI